ncbi:hypothetical protein [Streptomyces sp. NPDC050528]|uniref:hypothetical protein n=1 Tax=unclassified Streptomyces TaxID=2593676 RepID=UPI00379D4EF1
MTRRKACPTCDGWQDFRPVRGAEKAAIRAEKGARHYVHDYWRCTAAGCLWYQRWYSRGDGGLLPEEFREEATPTA